MEKSNPPRHYGVFSPVGHTVLSFPSGATMESAAQLLTGQGFTSGLLTRYSPQDMITQAQADMQSAGALASVGQELNLVKALRTLAEQGHSFLVVETPDDGQADRLTELAASLGAVSAQRFGRFIVEDLDVGGPELAQSFESPDRELDIDPAQGTMR